MINGAHLLLYSKDPEADRAFFRDVLNFPFVHVGHGWIIFGLPPAEMGIHPGDGQFAQKQGDRNLLGAVLYLMCENLHAVVESLASKNVPSAPVEEAEWGSSTAIRLPSGGEIGLYQPKHPTALSLPAGK